MSAYDYEMYFISKLWLDPADVVFFSYDGSHIECLGVVRLTVHYNDKIIKSFPFYIAEAGASTLGINLFGRLNFKLIDLSSQVIVPVLAHNTKISSKQFPKFLNGSGEFKYFKHKLD